jgi:putative drug exporter of the RND superfamily
MFDRLGAFVIRHRKLVLWLGLLFCVLAGGFGGTVSSRLSAGGYDVPGAQSTRAADELGRQFGTGDPNLVVLVRTPGGADQAQAAGTALTRQLSGEPGVQQVVSYWTSGRAPSLRSRGGDSALILAHLSGDENRVESATRALTPKYANGFQGLQVQFGGKAEAMRELTDQTAGDLAFAEIIILPLTLILLVFVFRGVVAALLPLAVGIVAILGALAVLRVLVAVTDVSVFAENITTGLGLGLGIDYSLFILSRYREELRNGAPVEEAIRISLRTAGRTVLFSALTVGLSLSALLLFPMYFLRSFGYAGIAVVVFAAVAALVLLPALLVVLGTRIDKWSWSRKKVRAAESGFWHRLATVVMKRPVPLATGVILILLVLGAPILHIRFSLADERTLPASAQAHQVGTVLRQDFSAHETEPLLVVAPGSGDPAGATAVADYATRLSRLPSVARVDALTGSYQGGSQVAPASRLSDRFRADTGTWLSVVPSVDAYSDAGQQLVRDVRALPSPFPVQVGGTAAAFSDTLDSLGSRLPYGLLAIAVSMFVLLFLLTGSVVMPLKALVLNLLSLSATFGAMVYVFQEGHLRWLTGDFTVTGAIVATIPVLMFCVAFGLSMDYEVFLLSRIKEEYDATGDNTRSVALGLERTGGLVTAAALIVALVFLSFLTSGITYMKLLGLGLALAVLMDASLIRGVLVPAFMRLAGRANWWAPAPLAALHRRIGISESDGDPTPAAGSAATTPHVMASDDRD